MSAPRIADEATGRRSGPAFGRHVLDIDLASAAARIEAAIRTMVGRNLHRRGVVVGISGGIDSALCAALAARALGPERVRALLMPGRNSSPESAVRARALCANFGIPHETREIGPALEALGCYRSRDAAIRKLFPGYHSGDRYKIVVPDDLLGRDRLNVFSLVVESAGRHPGAPAHAARRLPGDRRVHEHEAAHAQAHRVPRKRSASTTRSSARRTGSSTTRASSSAAATGSPTSSRSRTCTRRRSTRSAAISACPSRSSAGAEHGHLQPAADAGGVLLRAAVRPAGPHAVRRRARRRGRRGRRRPRLRDRAGRARVPRHRGQTTRGGGAAPARAARRGRLSATGRHMKTIARRIRVLAAGGVVAALAAVFAVRLMGEMIPGDVMIDPKGVDLWALHPRACGLAGTGAKAHLFRTPVGRPRI